MWVKIVVQLLAVLAFAVVCTLIKDRLLRPYDIALVAFVFSEFVSATIALPLPALIVCATCQSVVLPVIIWYALYYNSEHDIIWFKLCAGIVLAEVVLFLVYGSYLASLAGGLWAFFLFGWTVKDKSRPSRKVPVSNVPTNLKF